MPYAVIHIEKHASQAAVLDPDRRGGRGAVRQIARVLPLGRRGCSLRPPDAPAARGDAAQVAASLRRCDRLGGLFHEYQAAA
jgi:hypothetical protein